MLQKLLCLFCINVHILCSFLTWGLRIFSLQFLDWGVIIHVSIFILNFSLRSWLEVYALISFIVFTMKVILIIGKVILFGVWVYWWLIVLIVFRNVWDIFLITLYKYIYIVVTACWNLLIWICTFLDKLSKLIRIFILPWSLLNHWTKLF